jgi:hypothetical protein
MSNDNNDQQTADDPSTEEAAESDQQTSQDEVTDVQPAGDAGVAAANDNCAGWFADAESISKRAG